MTVEECATCGAPNLRPEGHAEWCADWEAMSQEAKNTAAYERAVRIGLSGLHHGDASQVQMAAAKKRIGLW